MIVYTRLVTGQMRVGEVLDSWPKKRRAASNDDGLEGFASCSSQNQRSTETTGIIAWPMR
jgi:hypothetical protein